MLIFVLTSLQSCKAELALELPSGFKQGPLKWLSWYLLVLKILCYTLSKWAGEVRPGGFPDW